MKRILILASLIASTAFAGQVPKVSSQEATSVVNADAMPRAILWPEKRTWNTTAGEILVCPFQYKASSYDKECVTDVKGDTKQYWMPLQSYKVPGMVLKGYEYRFTGTSGYQVLITYFGPPLAPTLAPAAGQPSMTVQNPVLKFEGPITIDAKRVTIRKH